MAAKTAKISTYRGRSAEQLLKEALPNEFLISVISTKLNAITEKAKGKTT